MTEVLINKKTVQYWTYCRNKYKEDKNNRTNYYSSYTGYGGEQQRYNKNAIQDNSINVINLQQGNNNFQVKESAEIGDIIV